jgi:hypothetical protein
VRVLAPAEGGVFASSQTELVVSVESAAEFLRDDVKVHVNGQLRAGNRTGFSVVAAGFDLKKTGSRYDFSIPLDLDDGENLIEVMAANANGFDSKTINVTCKAVVTRAKPDLWVLAIGVNAYDNRQRIAKLSYAAADARGITEAFKKQAGKRYREVKTLLIADKEDTAGEEAFAPTSEVIRRQLKTWYKGAAENDVLALFIAAHGVRRDGELYFHCPGTRP